MERPATCCAITLSMTKHFDFDWRALSAAVAHLFLVRPTAELQ